MALYWSAISSIVILGNRPQNGANLGYAAPCDRTSPLKPKAGLNGPPAIELPTQAKSRLEWAIPGAFSDAWFRSTEVWVWPGGFRRG